MDAGKENDSLAELKEDAIRRCILRGKCVHEEKKVFITIKMRMKKRRGHLEVKTV